MGSRKRVCQVPLCGNFKFFKEKAARDDLYFFSIPKDRVVPWTEAIGRSDLASFKFAKNYHVCSDHFREEDYLPNVLNTVFNQTYKKRLKLDAVPSLLLPTPEQILKINEERKQKKLIKSATDSCKLDVKKIDHPFRPNSPKESCSQCLLCSEAIRSSSATTPTSIPSNYQLPGSCQSSLLNEQLWSTFILRKIIQVPVWKFGELLSTTGLSVHPGKWFVLCDTCTQTVVNIMEIQDNIHKLELKVKELMKGMKMKFESSLEGKCDEGDDEMDGIDVSREIRQFFKASTATVEPKLEVDMTTHDKNNDNDTDTHSNSGGDYEFKTESEGEEELEPSVQGSDEDDYENGGGEDEDEDWIPTANWIQAEKSDDVEIGKDPLAVADELNDVITITIPELKLEESTTKFRKGQPERVYKCHLCPKEYFTLSLIKNHYELHSRLRRIGNGRNECSQCGIPYEKAKTLRAHLQMEHHIQLDPSWDGTNESQEDYISRTRTEKLSIHISGVLGRPKGPRVLEAKYQCPICPRKLTKKGYLDKHIEYHELTKSKYNGKFDCARCGVPFINHKNLRLHYSVQHKLLLDPIWKGEEGRQEDFLKELNSPRRLKPKEIPDSKTPNGDDVAKLKCPKCNISCKSQIGLTNHMKRKHKMKEAPAPLVCELCGYVFDSTHKRMEMEAHMLTHKIFDNSVDPTISTTDFICNLCNKLFSNRRDFRSHKLATHAEEIGLQVYKCSYCPKVFPRNHNRMFHELRIHKKKGLYPCDHCDYEAISRHNLELHMAKHTKSKQVCEYCSATYRSTSGLREHIQRFHPDKYVSVKRLKFAGVPVETLASVEGDQPLMSLCVRKKQMLHKEVKCKYCDAVLPHHLGLKMHLEEIHEDMYKFKCDLCEKVYMSLASLNLHKKVNHKEKDKKVRCGWCFKLVQHRISLYDHRKRCQKRPKEMEGQVIPKIMPVDEGESGEVMEQVD